MNTPQTSSSDRETPGSRAPQRKLGALLADQARGARSAAHRFVGRLGGMAQDGAHLARLQVNDVRLRRRLDEHYRALGRAVYQAHKHARGDSPFESLEEVKSALGALEAALGEYRTNREARAQTREQMRRSGD